MKIIDLTKRPAHDQALRGGPGQFCLINVGTTKTGGTGETQTGNVNRIVDGVRQFQGFANLQLSAAFALPMPSNLRRDYTADWTIDQVGLSERALADVSQRLKNLVNTGKMSSDKTAGMADIKGNAVNELAKIASSTAFRKTAREAGVAYNPHKELFYGGPAFRSHPLEFRFSFLKQEDAVAFGEMVEILAAAMSPDYQGDASSGVWQIPDTFFIEYVNAKDVGRPQPCVLTSIQGNLTESGTWKAFEDGRPAHVSLGLTFLELAPLTKRDILERKA